MLEPDSWLPQAQGLQVGQKRYGKHDCGDGRKLILSRDTNGYSAFCFRCSDRGWHPGPKLSLRERLEAQARVAAADSQSALLAPPEPAVRDVREWPAPAKLWLYRAGIGIPEIAKLGAYWHEATERVVIPVFDGEDVVFWQARALSPDRKPKYLNPPSGRDKVLARFGSGGVLVLTEDVLSAFKVGMVTEAWSLMGTSLSPLLLSKLLQRPGPVAVWLDPDSAGIKASSRIAKQLNAYGITHRVICSARDPKLHTQQEIKEYLT